MTTAEKTDEASLNKQAFLKLKKTFELRQQQLLQGGLDAKKQAHLARGKMLVRERIAALLDPKSPFDEIGLFAAYDCYNGDAPTAALVTGIGMIHDQPCMIIANDPTIKGGCFFPLTVKKHLRAQAVARKHRLPCLYLVDSGGAYLPLQDEVFPDQNHFGRIFYEQAEMSKEGIPQIAIVLGSCTAGGAYIPAMADQSIMVEKQATVFLAGPPLVKAATGEEVSAEALGGADLHCRTSGVADYLARSETEAFEQARRIVQHLPNNRTKPTQQKVQAPPYPSAEIYTHIPSDTRFPIDAQGIIAHLVDKNTFDAFKPLYGPTLICGFAYIGGHLVGILANQGVLLPEAALKGTHFIELCTQRKIPLVFLQNITGFMVGKRVEENGIAKHGAKMVMAVANAKIPKFTVFMGASYGAGNYAMCGAAFDPNRTWMWPNASMAVMGSDQANHVLSTVGSKQKNLREDYQHKSTAYYAASQMWVDALIDPSDTREHLIRALNLCDAQRAPDAAFGVFRM